MQISESYEMKYMIVRGVGGDPRIFLATIVALYLAMSVRRSVRRSVGSNEFQGV